MAHDEFQENVNEHSQSGEPRPGALAPMTIDTVDPVSDSTVEHSADLKLRPTATIRIETTEASEADRYRVTGVRSIVPESRPQNGATGANGSGRASSHKSDGEQPDQDRSPREDTPQGQPSMIKHLLITAGVALLCGVFGAMGYAYFFDAKSRDPSDKSLAKSDSASKKDSDSDQKSTAAKSHDSSTEANTHNAVAGAGSASGPKVLNDQIKELSQRIDQLRERVDNVTRPTDEPPPAVRTLQVRMSQLTQELALVATLPAAYRHYNTRLEIINEEVKSLRTKIEAIPASSIGDAKRSLTPLRLAD